MPSSNADYKRIAELIATYFGGSQANTHLTDIAWDQTSNPGMYNFIMNTLLVVATNLLSAIATVEAGDKSDTAKAALRTYKAAFDAALEHIFDMLEVSQQSPIQIAAAYQGMGLEQTLPHPPHKSTRSVNTEIIALGYALVARQIFCKLMGNSADGSHHLEKGQQCRRIKVIYVERDCFDYPDHLFEEGERYDVNVRVLTIAVAAIHSGKKMVARACYVSKLREEGPLGPPVEIILPWWNVEVELAADAALKLRTTHPDVHNADGTLKDAPKDVNPKGSNA